MSANGKHHEYPVCFLCTFTYKIVLIDFQVFASRICVSESRGADFVAESPAIFVM